MKGIVIWAHSNCRSVMGLYREMIRAAECPALITLWRFPKDGDARCGVRLGAGFRPDEFCDLPMMPVGDDYNICHKVLIDHKDWIHLFCDYQLSSVRRQLILEAKSLGCTVGVLNEAPCNMEHGFRKILKEIFLYCILRWKVRAVIKAADFFVNYSGRDDKYLSVIGWPKDKIIHLGYFPPPIEGTRRVKREKTSNFHILATGILSRYRGADVLVKALRILKDRGVKYRATITQEGELLDILRAETERYNLPIEFPGFLPLEKLIELYETCSVYVGSGRHEPWGMRLNDALNCGSPLIVSKGMGGEMLVSEYGCGDSFESGDAVGLANALQRMICDDAFYRECADNAYEAFEKISPRYQAGLLVRRIEERIKNEA